jgi:hypothetical protein
MKVRTTHKDTSPGAAWLSSARTLKRMLKCNNERNPYHLFYLSSETASDKLEEGKDDAKSARPFDVLGRTHDTMGLTMGCQAARRQSRCCMVVVSSYSEAYA